MAAATPEKILKDLSRVWADLANQENATDPAGVLRACAMTLIVGAEPQDDPQATGETIAHLMREFPSRAIVLRVKADSEPALDANVSAQCWMTSDRREQVCCEQIEIAASESALTDAPKLVVALIAPDLPVVLWIRCPKLCVDGEIQGLFPLSEKLIVDSAKFATPEAGSEYVAGLLRQGINVADLAWTRLTPWRESVARLFDDDDNLERLPALTRVGISHVGQAAPVAARYLAGWFRSAVPPSVEIALEPAAGGPDAPIRGIALDGPGFSATIAIEDSYVVTRANRIVSRFAFSPPTDYELLREELGILGSDPVFRAALQEPRAQLT
jgi:hypothetical protein